MKKVIIRILLLLILSTSFDVISVPSVKAALMPGTYTIENILAHDPDQYTKHPRTVAEILAYVDSGGVVAGRTGWSAYELICRNNQWEKGTVTVTSDSGRDKFYYVSDYQSEIVEAYGIEIYEAALASGIHLKYQPGSKTDDPTGEERKWYPCRDGERGGYYNNVDFMLTMTFTVGDDIPPPGGNPPKCEGDCDLPPPDLYCSINTQVSETGSMSSTGANITADPNGKIIESHESDVFDVLQYGIPSSEYLKVNGKSEKYLTDYRYKGMTGTVTYSFKVTKDYHYRWEEAGPEDEEGRPTTVEYYQHIRQEYPVQDSYNISYWLIGHLNVYGFMDAVFRNYALPGGQVTVPNPQQPTARGTHNPSTNAHVFPKPCSGIYLGTETINGRPSGTPNGNLSAYAQLGSRAPDVKNDYVNVDGFISMSDQLVSQYAPTPRAIPRAPQVSVERTSLLIDPLKVNKWQTASSITANYRSIFTINSSNGSLSITGHSPEKINTVTVHTPVVMYARATDDKEHDQRTNPPIRSTPPDADSDRHAFILDRPFEVTLPTTGQHLETTMAPGYGDRDYLKYTREKEVQFPFDVYTETKQGFYPKDTWIKVPNHMETVKFFLPVWVPEGEYAVKFRSIAINAPDVLPEEHHANLNLTYRTPDEIMENHVAYDTVKVDVVGRLYDFRLTDIQDFQWEPVFRMLKGTNEHTGNYYWVGDKMIDGEPRGNSKPFILPVRHGSHSVGYPNQMKNVAVKTGYHFKFDMKTKGDLFKSNDAIRITPSFYFVNKDGTDRRPVDVYYHNDADYFVRIGSDLDREYRKVKLNEPLRNVQEKQLYDTAEYLYRHPQDRYTDLVHKMSEHMFIRTFLRKYSKEAEVTGPYSWQVLNRNLRTFIGPDRNEVPTNPMIPSEDVKAREQMWYGEYSLPADIWVVDKGRDIAGYGIEHRLSKNSSVFLRDGFVIVNFNIETIENGDTNNPRLQYHKGPLNNQWKKEGFQYNFTDPYGYNFDLLDGDVLFYHGDQSSYDDFGARVTH